MRLQAQPVADKVLKSLSKQVVAELRSVSVKSLCAAKRAKPSRCNSFQTADVNKKKMINCGFHQHDIQRFDKSVPTTSLDPPTLVAGNLLMSITLMHWEMTL